MFLGDLIDPNRDADSSEITHGAPAASIVERIAMSPSSAGSAGLLKRGPRFQAPPIGPMCR